MHSLHYTGLNYSVAGYNLPNIMMKDSYTHSLPFINLSPLIQSFKRKYKSNSSWPDHISIEEKMLQHRKTLPLIFNKIQFWESLFTVNGFFRVLIESVQWRIGQELQYWPRFQGRSRSSSGMFWSFNLFVGILFVVSTP